MTSTTRLLPVGHDSRSTYLDIKLVLWLADWSMIPDWKALRSVTKAPFVERAYMWFFAVPIAAKFLLQLKSPIKVDLWGQIHSIELSLPFSWQYLFFASVGVALGNFIFRLRCPQLVQDYLTPQESYGAGNGSVFLCQELSVLPYESWSDSTRSALLYLFRTAERASANNLNAAQDLINKQQFEMVDE